MSHGEKKRQHNTVTAPKLTHEHVLFKLTGQSCALSILQVQ